MPTPMCAARIIPTSLAPSPMASVIARARFFTRLVTWGVGVGGGGGGGGGGGSRGGQVGRGQGGAGGRVGRRGSVPGAARGERPKAAERAAQRRSDRPLGPSLWPARPAQPHLRLLHRRHAAAHDRAALLAHRHEGGVQLGREARRERATLDDDANLAGAGRRRGVGKQDASRFRVWDSLLAAGGCLARLCPLQEACAHPIRPPARRPARGAPASCRAPCPCACSPRGSPAACPPAPFGGGGQAGARERARCGLFAGLGWSLEGLPMGPLHPLAPALQPAAALQRRPECPSPAHLLCLPDLCLQVRPAAARRCAHVRLPQLDDAHVLGEEAAGVGDGDGCLDLGGGRRCAVGFVLNVLGGGFDDGKTLPVGDGAAAAAAVAGEGRAPGGRTLSPVSTQILMPASANAWRHSGTPSCSLSSTAVAPTSSRRCSIASLTLAMRPSRSSIATDAALGGVGLGGGGRGAGVGGRRGQQGLSHPGLRGRAADCRVPRPTAAPGRPPPWAPTAHLSPHPPPRGPHLELCVPGLVLGLRQQALRDDERAQAGARHLLLRGRARRGRRAWAG
jgi:hypothetical protein